MNAPAGFFSVTHVSNISGNTDVSISCFVYTEEDGLIMVIHKLYPI